MNPTKPGRYLVLAYEWVGLQRERPEKPEWFIRHWRDGDWERQRYYWDTGGYENFEVVRWQDLPPI
jgi:hypothetical protein